MHATNGGFRKFTCDCTPESDVDDPCPKVMRLERLSPVSVDHVFDTQVTIPQRLSVLPMCTNVFHYVYDEIVCRGIWNARFERGRSGAGAGAGAGCSERRLATQHLEDPSTDGWNVVAGASALALEWAISAADIARHTADEDCELTKDTRIRLAVCLSVSWKFERSYSTNFPRIFHTCEPNIFSPHTHELAFIGYAFLTPEERCQFGPWETTNTSNIRFLYHKMVVLEMQLMRSVNVYELLVRNVQVLSEERIATLFDACIVDADAAMAMRSIVPLFMIASQDGKCSPPIAGALVCASMMCMSISTTVNALVLQTNEMIRELFTVDERRGARALIEQVVNLKGVAKRTVSSTCYCNSKWVHHPFVCIEALRMALLMAHELT